MIDSVPILFHAADRSHSLPSCLGIEVDPAALHEPLEARAHLISKPIETVHGNSNRLMNRIDQRLARARSKRERAGGGLCAARWPSSKSSDQIVLQALQHQKMGGTWTRR